MPQIPAPKGRGTSTKPPNRFEQTHLTAEEHQLEDAELIDRAKRRRPTQFLPDESRTVITTNDSPDIPFSHSINPYRGCEHGCSYCYARPTHEYLGMNSGLDFESKILCKYDAADRLRDELNRPKWQPKNIAISGITDCYQPVERKLKITRSLLEVLLEARNPVGIITKNALVTRDLDLLTPLAERNLVHVFISLTTLDGELARNMEPRTSSPPARLQAIEQLAEASIPVGVMVAPVVPGLTDEEVPALLQAGASAGARAAGYQLLRLPLSVETIFIDWLAEHYPDRRERVEGLIRQTRGGQLSDSRFGHRMRGEGVYAQTMRETFRLFAAQSGLQRKLPPLDCSQFRPPRSSQGQLRLF